MFKAKFSKKTFLSVINNNVLYFIAFDKHSNGSVFHSVSLGQFLNGDPDSALILESLKNKTNALLILPDYWSGNTSYMFQSKRGSLAKAFIERKLSAEHPDKPDIKHFFDFTFSPDGLENRKVDVFFLQEPRAFKLYQKFSDYNLDPARISTPALLWEQKLINTIPDFDIGGTCFIHLLPSECFLYFFSQGRFIFSRSITFPDFQTESAENSSDLSLESPNRYTMLTYEINQSLYLFSQKTKSEMGKIYLISPDRDSARILSDNLGREVTVFSAAAPGLKGLQESPEISEYLGPVGPFNTVDLSPSKLYFNLTHCSLRKILEWKPVQTFGMVLGLTLVLLLAVESLFLWGWSRVNRDQMAQSRSMNGARQNQLIREYDQALDLITAATDRPSPRNVIIKIGNSLPDNTWIMDMNIETETPPGVVINGVIKASGADQLRNTLATLLKNLNRHFQGTRALSIQDIDFKIDKSQMQPEYQNFLFTLKFNLP